MSHHVLRCKEAACRAPIFWASTDTGRRIALNDRALDIDEARENPEGVHFLDPESGRVLRWTPMLMLDTSLLDLYRAHSKTCAAPRIAPVPQVEPIARPEPDPQLRLPVLPRRLTRHGGAGQSNTHERGNHEHHRNGIAA